MKRILIIGGTGMLRDATEYFVSNDYQVSVIGRDIKKLNYFTSKFPDKKTFDLISIDYTKTADFIKIVAEKIKDHGSFDILISWMHSNGSNSLLQLIDTIKKYNDRTVLYHIKGSMFYDALKNSSFNPISTNNKLIYREIFLGFKIENNSSRWLTNAEISSGVIEAVKSNKDKSIIGQIEPLDLIPL